MEANIHSSSNIKLKFSIIIPNYNYGQLISKAIDSAISQNISNKNNNPNISLEIVVIDDCSTDNSLEVLESYSKDNKIKLLINTTNKGAAYSRNKGIEASTGDYIIFLDADDVLTQNSLYSICEFIKSSIENLSDLPRIILTNHNNYYLDQNNKKIIKKSINKTLSSNNNIRFIDYLFNKKISVTAGSIIFHKSFFNQTNNIIRFSEELKLNEDLAVFALAMLEKNFVYYNITTVEIYKHPASLRNQYNLLDITNNTEGLTNIIFNNPLLPIELKYLRNKFISLRYLSMFRTYFLAKKYTTARQLYHMGIKHNFSNIFKFNYFIKYIKSYI